MADESVGLAYVNTVAGRLKMAQTGVNAISFLCIIFAYSTVQAYLFIIVSLIAFAITLGLFLIFIWGVVSVVTADWSKIELCICAILAILYLAVSCTVFFISSTLYHVAGVFGLIATVLYGADAFMKFKGQ